MPDPIEYVETYFTFGFDHKFPNGKPASGEYVIVASPPGIDHREVLCAFLGGRGRFASEYTSREWTMNSMNERHYDDRSPAYIINVIERAGDGN